MIITPHILVGAAIALKIKNPILVFIAAFLSHFVLDLIPHSEYNINVLYGLKFSRKFFRENLSRKYILAYLKILSDFFLGIFLISFILSVHSLKFSPLIYLGIFSSILPDIITIIFWQTKILVFKRFLHFRKIHSWWGILPQIGLCLIVILIIIFVF